MALSTALGGCGSVGTNLFGTSDNFFSSLSKTSGNASTDTGGNANAASTDIDCPEISIRNGASTLLIGSKPGDAAPAALDVRYQGSIIRTARECHVNAGIVTMKVGIEGRIITGPAGGPGTVDVPLRIAVVHEGVNPRTVLSKFAREQVAVNSAVDRVTFTHIDPEISFPLPQPVADIDAYVVYVGFDPLGAPQPKVKKKPVRQRTKPSAKPKPAAQPGQS
jgi:hypothetical protein